MSLDKILSVSGKPGLYRMLTQTRTGLVAESLIDGKRITVGMRHNVSLLSEISVFTLQDEMPLREVFLKIQEKEGGGKASIPPKSSKDELEEYFFSVLPDYDEDRVYPSHISKILKWYNMLIEQEINDFSEAVDGEGEDPTESAGASEKKPAAAEKEAESAPPVEDDPEAGEAEADESEE